MIRECVGRVYLLTMLAGLAFTNYAQASDIPDVTYLEAMPSAAQVTKDYTDSDQLNALAMQHGAFRALEEVIEDRTLQDDTLRPHRAMTQSEAAKYKEYNTARYKVRDEIDKFCIATKCDQEHRYTTMMNYANGGFHFSVLRHYFTYSWLADQLLFTSTYGIKLIKYSFSVDWGKHKGFIATIFLILGFAGALWVGRREFYRTNNAGVEEFSSYTTAILSRIGEGVILLISVLIIVIGIFLF